MQSNRSHEFDYLFSKKRNRDYTDWDYTDIITLFNDSIPYSFNLFAEKKPDVAIAREIIDHLQNGYPYQGKMLRFESNPENVYAYLLMIKSTANFAELNGEVARKLNYAIERISIRGQLRFFTGIHPTRFGYVLKELAEEEQAELSPPAPN